MLHEDYLEKYFKQYNDHKFTKRNLKIVFFDWKATWQIYSFNICQIEGQERRCLWSFINIFQKIVILFLIFFIFPD